MCVCICMYIYLYVNVYMYVCMYVYVCMHVCMQLCMCVCIYRQKKVFEQNLQTATRHTKHYNESPSTRFVQIINVIKMQKSQELECFNTCSFPYLFSYVLAIILTSVSIPFINCYGRNLPFVIRK